MSTEKSGPEALTESELQDITGAGVSHPTGSDALFGSDCGAGELQGEGALASWKTTVDNLAIGNVRKR